MISGTNAGALQATFRALADPTRRNIIDLLSDSERTVGEVAVHFEMTRAAVKKHLVVLEEGGIVVSRTRGRECINRLEPTALKRAVDWLNHFDRFWDDRFEALREALEEDDIQQEDKDNG